MNEDDSLLEAIVKSGNVQAVIQFTKNPDYDFSDSFKQDKIAEAQIYSAMSMINDDIGCEPDDVYPLIQESNVLRYLEATSNAKLLIDFIDALQSATYVCMESYAQIEPVEVLDYAPLSDAVRRNMNPELREKVAKFIKTSYSLVFDPDDMDRTYINHYFPMIDKWRDFVDTDQVVVDAIQELVRYHEKIKRMHWEIDDERMGFVYAALEKFIDLTSLERVSELMKENLEDSKIYRNLAAENKINT